MNAALQILMEPAAQPDRYSRAWFDKQMVVARSLDSVLQSRWKWNCTKKVKGYKGLFPEQGQMTAANAELRMSVSTLVRADLNLASDDESLRDWSKAKARQFETWVHDRCAPKSKALSMLQPYGLSLPQVKKSGDKDEEYHRQVLRLCSVDWWLRQTRVLCQRHCEALLRDLGETRKHRGAYVSDHTLKRMLSHNYRNQQFLKYTEAENDLGQVFSLDELAALGTSNPVLRRGELMLRIRGFQEWADRNPKQKWRGMFYTLTCPSKYHAWHSKGGKNAAFNSSTPLDGQRYLTKVWAQIRACAARDGIPMFGFRVAEPHHDGTPHWHVLTFVPRARRKALTRIMRKYALNEDGAEPGAKKYRFEAVVIDPRRGGAAGYIAKYISKNIDGFAVDIDREVDAPAAIMAARVKAWSQVWGIRQFQQFGGPPVTVWREARRLASNPAQLPKEGQLPVLAEQIIDSADRGLWAEFVELMGGAVRRRELRPMKSFYLFSQALGRYGEQVKRIKGVTVVGFLYPLVSRPRKWITRRIQGARDWVAALVAASPPPLDLCQ